MSYAAKILDDSIADNTRLTTFEITIPRIVLADLNTHRMLSRNSASSRAIPVEKRIRMVRDDPYVPDFASNRPGMQPGGSLGYVEQQLSRQAWLDACEQACRVASEIAEHGAHKQWANRLIEPFCWHTVIVSSTTWDNFFAQPQREIRVVAGMMRDLLASTKPTERTAGEWHLPLVRGIDERELKDAFPTLRDSDEHVLAKISAGRCARVSYLTHDGRRDPGADLGLYDRLVRSGHMSPLEHPAMVSRGDRSPRGNFRSPWLQLRKTIIGEDVFRG